MWSFPPTTRLRTFQAWRLSFWPTIWRISNTYSALKGAPRKGAYWAQAFATISQDGHKVFWGNNWLDPMGGVDLYQANLPATWWEDLGSKPPDN